MDFKNELDSLNLNFNDPDAWFDLWHLHFDWDGEGNESFEKRMLFLDKLFWHLELLEEKAKQLKKPYQIFALINEADSSADAIYLHTPNPNRDNFPLNFDHMVSECCFTDSQLIAYLNDKHDLEKCYSTGDSRECILTRIL